MPNLFNELTSIIAPFFDVTAARTSGTSTPIVGTSGDLPVLSEGDLTLLEGSEGKRVVVPPKTHLRSLPSILSQAGEGEASSSVPRIRLPSPLYLPQAPAPAEGKEDSFDINLFLEPFSESETEGTPLNVVSDQAGPPHQYQQPPFVSNQSLEASLKRRITILQSAESPFLPQDKKDAFWEDVRASRNQASSQKEYNRIMEFENRDLQIREQKDECFRLLETVLRDNPDEKNNFKPEEALKDFFSEIEEELAAENGGSLLNDAKVFSIIQEIKKDLLKCGKNSYYFQKIRSRFD